MPAPTLVREKVRSKMHSETSITNNSANFTLLLFIDPAQGGDHQGSRVE